MGRHLLRDERGLVQQPRLHDLRLHSGSPLPEDEIVATSGRARAIAAEPAARRVPEKRARPSRADRERSTGTEREKLQFVARDLSDRMAESPSSGRMVQCCRSRSEPPLYAASNSGCENTTALASRMQTLPPSRSCRNGRMTISRRAVRAAYRPSCSACGSLLRAGTLQRLCLHRHHSGDSMGPLARLAQR